MQDKSIASFILGLFGDTSLSTEVVNIITDIQVAETGATALFTLASAGATIAKELYDQGRVLLDQLEADVKAEEPKVTAALQKITKGALADLKAWLAARKINTATAAASGGQFSAADVSIL